MSTKKRLRAPLVVMFGVITAMVTFAGPANADPSYPPPPGIKVLGTSASASTTVRAAGTTTAAASAGATSGLAFTGANALGAGALGGLLLVGGVTLVLVGKRNKVND